MPDRGILTPDTEYVAELYIEHRISQGISGELARKEFVSWLAGFAVKAIEKGMRAENQRVREVLRNA